jgi:hypothetical protein
MSSRIHNLVRAGILLLFTAALAAPTATAGGYGPDTSAARDARPPSTLPAGTCHQYCDVVSMSKRTVKAATPLTVPTKIVSRDGNFHWLDAALGFGFAWGAMLIGAGVLVASRRSHAAEYDSSTHGLKEQL